MSVEWQWSTIQQNKKFQIQGDSDRYIARQTIWRRPCLEFGRCIRKNPEVGTVIKILHRQCPR